MLPDLVKISYKTHKLSVVFWKQTWAELEKSKSIDAKKFLTV